MMIATSYRQWLSALIFVTVADVALAQASTPPPPAPTQTAAPAAAAQTPPVPVSKDSYTFEQLGYKRDMNLLGIRNSATVEFTMRRDLIATAASLNLVFTPSPALLPKLSHVRAFLNDQLMDVVPITAEMLGKKTSQRLELDPRYVTDFNQLRLDFVGHYTDLCENLAHSSLWLDVSNQSTLDIDKQALDLRDDLAIFPQPFFDQRERHMLMLPMVFSGAPEPAQQRAAAIMASYFGAQAQWRGAKFPVSFDTLPNGHAIVFATNERRPAFLQNYPKTDAPTVIMTNHPDHPYAKLLLIMGRNDDDLVQAAMALTLGNKLFRGKNVTIHEVQQLTPRIPYDAPNWTPTNRPVSFKELMQYPSQLEVSGLRPRPILLDVNLPPDLFIWRNQGIPMQLKYRYTPPTTADESRLNVDINSQFIKSFPLLASDQESRLSKLRLPLLPDGMFGTSNRVLIPALKVGAQNTVRFDFSFASRIGSAQAGTCQTMLPADVRASVDDDSTLDFSGYYHYMALPNLRAYAGSGYPFSRMADLSETLVVVPSAATPAQVATLLDAVGNIGATTGYPGVGLRITNDWNVVTQTDADLLVIGPMPTDLRARPDTNILLENTRSWLRQPRNANQAMSDNPLREGTDAAAQATTGVSVSSQAPIAAFVGMRSPFHSQRSVVGLLATSAEDYALLRNALGDVGLRAAIGGTVAIVRDAGLSSEQVGPVYYVGNLPWWTLLWFHLSDHPVLLAIIATLAVILFAFVLWYGLRWVARQRLRPDEKA